MNELALFAGAGGGILGGHLLGWRTVCAVEIEDYARRVLLQRQADGCLPRFPIWDDVTTFNGHPWKGKIDVISGGFPCEDISISGKGEGIGGERSGLWGEMARIVGEVRPRFVFVENSPMLVIRGLDRVLGDLAEMGYDAKWGVLGGRTLGCPIDRKRIWIVAHCTERLSKPRQSCCGETRRMGWKRKSLAWNEHWETALARFRRMGDGLARSVEQTDAIRKGQIPAVAALAWTTLIKRF